MKKLIGWLLVVLLAYYVITDPTGAARTGRDVLAGAKTTGTSVITFFKALSNV